MLEQDLDFLPDQLPAIRWGRVWAYILQAWRPYALRVGIVAALFLLLPVLELAIPWATGFLIDTMAQPATADQALYYAGLIMALFLIRQLVVQVGWLGMNFLTPDCMQDIANRGFAHLQRLATDWHINSFAGATTRKITRAKWGIDRFNDLMLAELLPTGFAVLAASISLFLIHPLLGIVLTAGGVFYLALSVFLTIRYISPAMSNSAAADSWASGKIADAVTNNSVTKAFASEARESLFLTIILKEWAHYLRRNWMRSWNVGALQGVMTVLLYGATVCLSLWLWQQGALTTGAVAAAIATYGALDGWLRNSGQLIRDLQSVLADMADIVDIQSQPAEEPEDKLPDLQVAGGHIVLEQVCFTYPAQPLPLFTNLSLTIAPGEVVAFVGPSGGGKSSLVKILQRLYPIAGGRILIDGQDVATCSLASVRRAFGVVPQDPQLFHRSIAANIAYGHPEATPAQIEQAARLAEAHSFITTLPHGYDTKVGERGVKLSGGQRQRVAIARALLADPHLLVLDEATSALDAFTEAEIQRTLARVSPGRTTIIIAHRLSTVMWADRVLVLQHGRVVEEGRPFALLANPDSHFARLSAAQAMPTTHPPAVIQQSA